MYHLEMRQFPKRVHRYNLDGREVGALLMPWVQEKIVELGEQKWSPHQATITILEGPEIALQEISMARGWRTAQREGRDVTEQLLAEARAYQAQATAGGGETGAAGGGAPAPQDAIALAVQLGALLGADATRLLDAWREIRGREPGLSPSAALALAEQELAAGS